MSSDLPTTPTPNRRIALLIDADNVSHTKIAAIVSELSRYGTANIRRAYGDWASSGLKGWTEKVHAYAIRPIQQFSYSSGKNATDIALVIDAMELLYTHSPAREGRNPSTGATIQIAASKKLSFAPAKAVKDKLNG